MTFFFFLFLTTIFYCQNLFFNKVFYPITFPGIDLWFVVAPFFYQLKESILNGFTLLWTNSVLSGFPILAEGQIGIFYPPYIFFVALFEIPKAVNFIFCFHTLLALCSMYLLSKKLNFSRPTAAFTALVFAFSGFFSVRFLQVNLFASAAWVPLCFYFLLLLLEKNRFLFGVLLAISLSLQFLAGTPQFVLYTGIGLFFYTIYHFWREKLSTILPILLTLIFSSILFILLVSIQLLPSLELTQNSWRQGGLSKDILAEFPYAPKHLLSFFNPYLFGSPADDSYPPSVGGKNWGLFWESTAYIGIIPLFLALAGAVASFVKKDTKTIFFTFLTILTLAFSLGKFGPLWWLITKPPLNYFRIPSRFLLIAVFSLSILAGSGLDILQKRLRGVSFKVLFLLIFVFTAFDLFSFAWKVYPRVSSDLVYQTPEVVNFLKKQAGLFRVASIDWEYFWPSIYQNGGWQNQVDKFLQAHAFLPGSINAVYDLDSIHGQMGIHPKNAFIYYNLEVEDKTVKEESVLKVLGMRNVKFILSSNKQAFKTAPIVFTQTLNTKEKVFVFENPFFMERAFVVFRPLNYENWLPFLIDLRNGEVDLTKEVWLEPSSNLREFEPTPYEITNFTYSIDKKELTLNANLLGNGYLVVSDTDYPGWQVFVDGKKEKILTASIIYRAVELEEGNRKVRFVYNPQSYILGERLTLLGLVILIVTFVSELLVISKRSNRIARNLKVFLCKK